MKHRKQHIYIYIYIRCRLDMAHDEYIASAKMTPVLHWFQVFGMLEVHSVSRVLYVFA